MVRPKTEEEIELLRINGELVSKTLAEVGKIVAPGVTTFELDRVAETFIRDNGAIPSFKGFEGFPSALCWSQTPLVPTHKALCAFLRNCNLAFLSVNFAYYFCFLATIRLLYF